VLLTYYLVNYVLSCLFIIIAVGLTKYFVERLTVIPQILLLVNLLFFNRETSVNCNTNLNNLELTS
jgi:hypothetical protein